MLRAGDVNPRLAKNRLQVGGVCSAFSDMMEAEEVPAMTVGQRIAQKRKELGLSQEALGEQLGVSRQSIYKWESDTVLPEVEKLIALSRLFSVSVGWLLGEEDAETGEEGLAPELTDTQLAMVKEIVDQYLTAREAAQPPRRGVLRVSTILAAVALIFALCGVVDQMLQSEEDYQAMLDHVNTVYESLEFSIDAVADEMDEKFRQNNSLTVDYQTQHLSTDIEANTATFRLYAIPKTFVPGMTAVFQARSREDVVELTAEPDGKGAFSGTLTCPLSDDISLFVTFVTGETEQTQLLEEYDTLYTDTFPTFTFSQNATYAFSLDGEDGVLSATKGNQGLLIMPNEGGTSRQTDMDIQVGLFRDGELVMWYDRELAKYTMGSTMVAYWNLPEKVLLAPGHEFTQVAIYTDENGRQLVIVPEGIKYHTDSGLWMRSGGFSDYSSCVDDWEF